MLWLAILSTSRKKFEETLGLSTTLLARLTMTIHLRIRMGIHLRIHMPNHLPIHMPNRIHRLVKKLKNTQTRTSHLLTNTSQDQESRHVNILIKTSYSTIQLPNVASKIKIVCEMKIRRRNIYPVYRNPVVLV